MQPAGKLKGSSKGHTSRGMAQVTVSHLCAHSHLGIPFTLEVVILVLSIVVGELVHTGLLLRTIACTQSHAHDAALSISTRHPSRAAMHMQLQTDQAVLCA